VQRPPAGCQRARALLDALLEFGQRGSIPVLEIQIAVEPRAVDFDHGAAGMELVRQRRAEEGLLLRRRGMCGQAGQCQQGNGQRRATVRGKHGIHHC